MTNWVTGHVIENKSWTESLFSLYIEAPIAPFVPGQFAKLALEVGGIRRQRAYSYVNAPQDKPLEFYLVLVQEGQLSEALYRLRPGDKLQVTEKAAGFFTLDEVPACKLLWMLATGTAIGPYLAMLQSGEGIDRFQQVILVHAVRYARDLCYWSRIQQLQQRYQGRLQVQAIISRESVPGALRGRVPALIASGELERAVGCELDADHSHIMLCGNPEMVRDTQKLLYETRGLQKNLRRKPGQVTCEHYW